MRCLLPLILLFIPYSLLLAQTEGGIEQYHYIGTNTSSTIVPVVHIQSKKGWYGEARYNYDEINTFTLLGGKTFSFDNTLPFSLTPMLGVSVGDFHGWTGGINLSMEKDNFFLSAQSQYTFSSTTGYKHYFFTWCEAGYQPLNWLYGGVSMQYTQEQKEKPLAEPGLMLGLSFKRVSFPLYVFNTFSNNRFIVLGVNWEWPR